MNTVLATETPAAPSVSDKVIGRARDEVSTPFSISALKLSRSKP